MTIGAGRAGATDGAGSGVTSLAALSAVTGTAATDRVVDADDDTPVATTWATSRPLSRTSGCAAGASTAIGLGLFFVDVLADGGRNVSRPFRRAFVTGASDVSGVLAAGVDGIEADGVGAVVAAGADEPLVVLVCESAKLLMTSRRSSERR